MKSDVNGGSVGLRDVPGPLDLSSEMVLWKVVTGTAIEVAGQDARVCMDADGYVEIVQADQERPPHSICCCWVRGLDGEKSAEWWVRDHAIHGTEDISSDLLETWREWLRARAAMVMSEAKAAEAEEGNGKGLVTYDCYEQALEAAPAEIKRLGGLPVVIWAFEKGGYTIWSAKHNLAKEQDLPSLPRPVAEVCPDGSIYYG